MKTESEIRAHLIQKAEADSAFRAQLLADPAATIQNELNLQVPAGFSVHVHEDTQTSAHLVLPPAGGRLSPAEMQSMAGGYPQGAEDISHSHWDGGD